jgi:hypothetical protein
VTAQSSHGHCTPTVKCNDRMRRSTDRTRRSHSAARPQSIDRTRSTQRPDTTVLASGHGLESSHHDRTRPITCDQTRRVSDQFYATCYSSGRLTGRAGPASDRTRRLQTLTPARLTTGLDASGQTMTVSGSAFGHPSCNRTDQIIRAQVQKQAPKRSNFRT